MSFKLQLISSCQMPLCLYSFVEASTCLQFISVLRLLLRISLSHAQLPPCFVVFTTCHHILILFSLHRASLDFCNFAVSAFAVHFYDFQELSIFRCFHLSFLAFTVLFPYPCYLDVSYRLSLIMSLTSILNATLALSGHTITRWHCRGCRRVIVICLIDVASRHLKSRSRRISFTWRLDMLIQLFLSLWLHCIFADEASVITVTALTY